MERNLDMTIKQQSQFLYLKDMDPRYFHKKKNTQRNSGTICWPRLVNIKMWLRKGIHPILGGHFLNIKYAHTGLNKKLKISAESRPSDSTVHIL